MITTKKVKLTPKKLFALLLVRYFKRRWWLFIWLFVAAIILGLDRQQDHLDGLVLFLAIFLPVILVLQFWRYADSKDNKLFLLERYYEIDSDKINGIIDNDTYSPINIEHIIKVDIVLKNYLLYISKDQFIYIPIDSFENDSDRQWFENEVIKKIKK